MINLLGVEPTTEMVSKKNIKNLEHFTPFAFLPY
jgi:hypothetical protein